MSELKSSSKHAEGPTTEDRNLSSKLQSMKFMKRSAEQAKINDEKKREQKVISESHWRATYASSDMPREKPKTRVVYESSYLKMPKEGPSGDQVDIGRRSFKSFNKETDKLNEEYEERQRAEKLVEEGKKMAVDDQNMAKVLGSSKESRTRPAPPTSLRERNAEHKRRRQEK
ncbi:hypothetical protein LPJ53_001194 [Coemansia erecta]|uniref:M-phase phosphoprotein 6 n=1 Tax=Coemansia erecta TaxID=147472 RepID=A0A9W7Y5H3_9FUNG|nr:hypothetical protein LPJ53_001194 [Coemansia erecta]